MAINSQFDETSNRKRIFLIATNRNKFILNTSYDDMKEALDYAKNNQIEISIIVGENFGNYLLIILK